MSFIAWLQAWQTIYNSRAKCRRVREEGSRKTSACYFLIGALAPDTAELWSDARTVIWRIPLVFVALEVPLYRKCDMSQWGQRSEWSSRGLCDGALQLPTVSGHKPPHSRHMTSWGSCCFWGKGWAPANTYPANKKSLHLWCCKPPTWRHRYWLSSRVCWMPDCHVHQHPPPTNGLIWPPPPPMVAATSLMPNRPARGLLSEGEGARAWIPQSNLNM